MRTSLNEIRDIERHLLEGQPAGEALVFEARLLVEPELKSKTLLQRKLYELLAIYQRKKIKEQVLVVHANLFTDEAKRSFHRKIELIFNQ